MRIMTKILAVLLAKFQELEQAFSDDDQYAPWMDYSRWQATRLPECLIRAERRAARHAKKKRTA